MNEKLKLFFKIQWSEPRRFFGWLVLFSLAGLAAELLASQNYNQQIPPDWLTRTALTTAAILLASFAVGFLCMVLAWIPPIHRLLAWLLQHRWFTLACLVTLVGLFYAEENWRGKRAWDNYRREWEAKGERFDFESIIPPPVPDDQNFALTPIWVESMKAVLGPKNSHQWFGKIFAENGRTNFTDRLAMSIYRERDYGDTNLNLGSWQKAMPTNLKAWQNYYRNPKANPAKPNAIATNEFPVSPEPQTPADDVLLALSKYDSVVNELRKAAKLPYSRFPLGYNMDEPFLILLPHAAVIKRIAQYLNLHASAELEANQPEKALADIMLGFRCNESIRTEPFLISHLVRIACQAILMQPIWEGLAQQKWSDAQISELENELGKQDYLVDYQQAMRGERACSIATIDYLRRNRKYGAFCGDADFESGKIPPSLLEMLAAVGWHSIPDGWFYETELTLAQMHQRWNFPMVDLQKRLVSPQNSSRLTNEAHKAMEVYSVRNILVRMLYPAIERAHRKFATIQAQLDLARIACALEHYRLAHGEYPENLETLAPQFIRKLPNDVINGQPFHYRREAKGQFVLYSVGWNETDDGGVVAFKKSNTGNQIVDPDNGDWVWRYPEKT